MKQLMWEANSFSKINRVCAVTQNPFVGFDVYLVDMPAYLKNRLLSFQYFVWKRTWWGTAEIGW